MINADLRLRTGIYLATLVDGTKTVITVRDDDLVFLLDRKGAPQTLLCEVVRLDLIASGKDLADRITRAARPDYLPT